MKTIATALLTLLIGFTGCTTFEADIILPDGSTRGRIYDRDVAFFSDNKADTYIEYIDKDGASVSVGRGTSKKAADSHKETSAQAAAALLQILAPLLAGGI